MAGCQSEKEKILLVKAMGNMGAKELISSLKEVIVDKSQPKVVRVEAIFALRKVAKSYETMVRVYLIVDAVFSLIGTSFTNVSDKDCSTY